MGFLLVLQGSSTVQWPSDELMILNLTLVVNDGCPFANIQLLIRLAEFVSHN